MVVTTSDGEVVTVDLEGGLSKVPAQYRNEVAAQLEALRKLATRRAQQCHAAAVILSGERLRSQVLPEACNR